MKDLEGVIHSLRARQRELTGGHFNVDAIMRVSVRLPESLKASFESLFELPLRGLLIQFIVDDNGDALPSPEPRDETDELVPCFGWYRPESILGEYDLQPWGRRLHACGYIPIGNCGLGSGDDYFINWNQLSPTPLYQLYPDWVRDVSVSDPLPKEAVHLVAPSLEQVLRVATLSY